MQTRKKSVSLAALGIAIPGNHNQRSAHRTSNASSPVNANNKSSNDSEQPPPAKRVKRSSTLSSATSTLSSPASPHWRRNASTSDQQQQTPNRHEHTPPRSPEGYPHQKIDLQGIDDDVVVAVLQQLENTGNRPHLIKELAAILKNSLKAVESSSNPVAIVSSRLTNYLRRPWTALAPCPLAKEQVNVHPRRVYYYLTTQPRQSIPETSRVLNNDGRIISPSASSGPDEDTVEKQDNEITGERSPSPELGIPDLDFSNMPSFSGLSFSDPSYAPTQEQQFGNGRRAASPPLEYDEREFTQTASVMLARKQSEQAEQEQQQSHYSSVTPANDSPSPPDLSHSHSSSEEPFPSLAASPPSIVEEPESNNVVDENEETSAKRNHEAAEALFGRDHIGTGVKESSIAGALHFNDSSPILQPSSLRLDLSKEALVNQQEILSEDGNDAYAAWSELRSPENVGLHELDDLLGEY